ncbi:hypothetical protein OH805_18895 [Streptomyces sp. NBC_00879]|uniref:hypothetical protein n=1 Tax=Streptomyces sp. NBC_00879 TaxID=2975855 RepID=UPI00386B1FA8|nr:hypothetical protein OH805_18895 [Streptomyces sp. NBC_00879]
MKSGVSPTVLVLVALITALASLIAAAIAGWIAARNTRKSLKNAGETTDKTLAHAAAMADLDREADKAAQLRSARRTAYAAVLTTAHEARQELRDLAARRVMTHAELQRHRAAVRDAAIRMVPTISLVDIEGPTEVSDAAHAIQANFSAVITAVNEAVKATAPANQSGGEKTWVLSEEGRAKARELLKTTNDLLVSFRAAARDALNA